MIIKLPDTSKQILIHGCLLMGKLSAYRTVLIDIAKKENQQPRLEFPAESVATVLYFLKWIYNDNIFSAHGSICSCGADHSVTWPDLMDLWIFASKTSMPKLQNHAIDVLVRNINGSLKLHNLQDKEADQRRDAFNLLWPDKHQARDVYETDEALKPLRTLMMNWFANPMVSNSQNTFFISLFSFGICRGRWLARWLAK